MSNIARKPNIEIRRKVGSGYYRTYGHLYWRPFIVVAFGRVLVGRKRLARSWATPDRRETP
jgi:hypothetical protein